MVIPPPRDLSFLKTALSCMDARSTYERKLGHPGRVYFR
jgi:hypothetical protein